MKRICLAAALSLMFAVRAFAQFSGPEVHGTLTPTQAPTLTTDQSILFPAAQDMKLHQGDVLTIRVYGQTDYASGITVGTDGKVLLPLIGVVSLDGLTVTEAEKLIANSLKAAGMFVDPQVLILITEGPNAVVTVIGEAHGAVPVTGPRRLLDVLAAAGGLPVTASHIITINRPGLASPIVVDLGTDPTQSALANVPVFPGDTIVTARVGVIYVIGAFKTPGTIGLAQNTPLTLMQATALSGGITFEGKYSDLRIIRTNGQQRTVVKLDLKKVLYGKEPDPILQANDIVFLPNSALKASITNGSAGTALGLLSVAISTFAILRYN